MRRRLPCIAESERHRAVDEPEGQLLGQCADGKLVHILRPNSSTTPTTSVAAARRDLFAYIETYYNRQRLHSALGYLTPEQAEVQAA
jgi:transposase InsO family protein